MNTEFYAGELREIANMIDHLKDRDTSTGVCLRSLEIEDEDGNSMGSIAWSDGDLLWKPPAAE